ncbi:MAG TPA: helix-hairpin-helix domain-containing protein [Thermodesulfobacteriota bacterium]|nr:helix-hairpin-helix domain-containing protein [Thermodesulfobacteriota bacterium]
MTNHKVKKPLRLYSTIFLAVLIGFCLTVGKNPVYAETSKPPVDLNTASQKDLEAIKGVGPATAKKIIAGRPYKTMEDLKKAGLSEKAIESIKPFVIIGTASPAVEEKKPAAPAAKQASPTATEKEKPKAPAAKASTKLAPGQKVNLNTATKEELDALPEIGAVKAQAIIDGRPYKTIEDVMKVKGIKEGTFNKIKDSITVK